jgi:hypothetical protein
MTHTSLKKNPRRICICIFNIYIYIYVWARAKRGEEAIYIYIYIYKHTHTHTHTHIVVVYIYIVVYMRYIYIATPILHQAGEVKEACRGEVEVASNANGPVIRQRIQHTSAYASIRQ